MKRLIAPALAGILVSTPGFADVNEQEIALLREQVRILTERLDQLEQSRHEQGAESTAVDSQVEAEIDRRINQRFADSWTDRISWKGDFRYRYENIDVEGSEERNRQRIRARTHLEARINDDMRIGLGLASGGDDPVSTNQTLGAGGSTKDINLDLAYFQWDGWRNTRVVGGKFKNMLYRPGKNGLLWDGDWNPEGLAAHWENKDFFASAFGTWVESDSRSANQEFSYGAQAGLKLGLGENVGLVAGAGYYRFDAAGKQSFFGDEDDFFGNSFDPATLTYLYDYHELEAFAELSFGFLGRPMSIFGDYVTNLDANDDDTGYAWGVKTGKAREPGSWDFAVIYEKLEADAVLGLLTDSDFGGGGTNAKGYIVKGTYALHKNWNTSFTYFINDIDINSGDPRNFDRLQLDLNFKYD